MTIAAGLLCREGVLLAADTEHTSWQTKSHASKIEIIPFQDGKVGLAGAGNTAFVSSAIRKFRDALTRTKTTDPLAIIESVHEKEYRRNVLKHPNHATEQDLHYWFLIGLWRGDKTKLYVTSLTAVADVAGFDCIGVGEPLASHIIGPAYSTGMQYSEALPIVAYALAHVKEHVRECGGVTTVRFIANDGSEGAVFSEPGSSVCSEVERYAKGYDFLTKRLLIHITDPTKDEQYFEANLQNLFVTDVMRLFREVHADRKKREAEIAANNPQLSPDRAKTLAVQLSMGWPPLLPPSPESPGGSGES